jgi:AraC-like DNA-binding protein
MSHLGRIGASGLRYNVVYATVTCDSTLTSRGERLPELIHDQDQQELVDLEQRITDALSDLREELEALAGDGDVPTIDPDYMDRWVQTIRRLTVQLSNELPPQLEPESVAEARKIIINLLDALEERDEDRPLDTLDDVFVAGESLRHIIRDALDEHVGVGDDDARRLVAYLKDALPRVTQADQARLAGISARHLQRLAKEGGTPPRQLVLAARLVKLLRYVWNPEGVVAWFHRERTELDGHAPIDVASDPGFERTLLRLARQGRAGHGS